jgi:hypothetical protein
MDLGQIGQFFSRGALVLFLCVPTFMCILLWMQMKDLKQTVTGMEDITPQLVCFDGEVCGIEINGTWYKISGIIDMEETIPPEYKWLGIVPLKSVE